MVLSLSLSYVFLSNEINKQNDSVINKLQRNTEMQGAFFFFFEEGGWLHDDISMYIFQEEQHTSQWSAT